MSRIFWDTNLFIYLIEDYGELSARVANVRERMLTRGDQLCTSTLTLGEVLVGPIKAGNSLLKEKYEEAISRSCVIFGFDREAARNYAQLRCDRSIKAPDALQLACAMVARVDLFITNDERLSGKNIPGIQFIVPLKAAYL